MQHLVAEITDDAREKRWTLHGPRNRAPMGIVAGIGASEITWTICWRSEEDSSDGLAEEYKET